MAQRRLVVTFGCLYPEKTLKTLTQLLKSLPVAVYSEHLSPSLTFPGDADSLIVSPNVTLRCVPSPFSRILAIDERFSTIDQANGESSLGLSFPTSSTKSLGHTVRAWTTYVRNHGRIPLKFCYHDVDVHIKVDPPSTNESSQFSLARRDGQLKEIALPDPGRKLMDTLENHPSIVRAVTGVYCLPASGVCLRPLPLAQQDHRLTVPTLVFHYSSETTATAPGSTIPNNPWARIGDRGGSHAWGQWIHTELLTHLDVRLCARTGLPQPLWAEAQSSLLAGSLDGLQSNRVLDATTTEMDARTNRADCWIEFRAQVKQQVWKGL